MIVSRAKKILLFLYISLFLPLIYLRIWARKQNKLKKGEELRILIIPQLTRIGDLVCATSLFRAIKEHYPQSFLAAVISKKIKGVISNNPRIDEIIIYQSHELSKLIYNIKKANFDWSFNLSGASFGTLLSLAGLIPNRAKIIHEEKSLSELVTDWLNNFGLLYKNHTYLPRRYLDLLEYIGIYHPAETREIFTSPQADQKINEWFSGQSISIKDSLVGIGLSTGNKIKEWGDAKFSEVAKHVAARYHAKVIFVGPKNDEARIERVLDMLGEKKFLKAVGFPLEELPSLIKRFNLFIAGDTGPLYIAHALKVPVIDIVGPVDPREQPPEDDLSILVKPPPDISPSSFVFKKPGKRADHRRAIETTSIESVIKAVDEMMSRIRSPSFN